jgi:SAM-dependent methyltransferase
MADLPPTVPAAGDAAPGGRPRRYSTAQPSDAARATAVVYGTDAPSETDLRLLGPVEGRRILDLGCGVGHNAVVLAQQGAKVLGVDPDHVLLSRARERAEAAEVRVELHQSALADLPFIRSDSVDAALSVMALATAEDLARVFRQVHRVLKPEAQLVASFPHPAAALFDPEGSDPLRAVHPYQQTAPITWHDGARTVVDHPRTIGEIFTTLQRASFVVDHVVEPVPTPARPGTPSVPTTLIIRARKQGN